MDQVKSSNMVRLKYTFIALALLLAFGCSSEGPAIESASAELDGMNVTTEPELSVLGNTTPVDSKLARLLEVQPRPETVAELPPLPMGGDGKSLSELLEYWKNGVGQYLNSPNSTPDGLGRVLDSSDGISWAIYQMPDITTAIDLQVLNVETSSPDFSGDLPGYWVGIANYTEDVWQFLSRSESAAFSRSLDPAPNYRSPGGNAFLIVLIDGGQKVTIDRAGFEYEVSGWQEMELHPSEGWTPAIDFALSGNPVVVFSNMTSGKPQMAVGDRTKNLMDNSSWAYTVIDNAPEGGVGTWLDVYMDAATNYPRVSMVYPDLSPDENNSKIGISVMVNFAGDDVFLNYRLQNPGDGYEWTTLDKRLDGKYGIVTHALNENSPESFAGDLHYRIYDIDSQSGTRSRDFGENLLYPHLKFHPGVGNATIAVHGGTIIYELGSSEWDKIIELGNTTEFGSLDYVPVANTIGSSYEELHPGEHALMHIPFNSGQQGVPEEIATQPDGPDQWIGRTSQIAYNHDGEPMIAFTQSNGSEVYVKFAFQEAGNWVVEDISNDPGTPSNMDDLVIVDLAVDSTGIPAVVYNYISGGDISLRFAIRGS